MNRFVETHPGLTQEAIIASLINAGLSGDAEVAAKAWLVADPNALEPHIALGQIYYTAGRWTEALPHYEVLRAADPGNPIPHGALCWAYTMTRNLPALRHTVSRAAEQIAPGRHLDWQAGRTVADYLSDDDAARFKEFARRQQAAIRNARVSRANAPTAVTWAPVTGAASVQLLGASRNIAGISAHFLIDGAQKVPATTLVEGATTIWSGEFTPIADAHHTVTLVVTDENSDHFGQPAPFRSVDPDMLWAETRDSSPVGISAMTVVGRVAAGMPEAEYRFEYGTAPDELGRFTDWAPLPGPLNAHLSVSPQIAPYICRFYVGAIDWDEEEGLFFCRAPFGKDPNHISGIGFLDHLFTLRQNSLQPDGFRDIAPHEGSDLRDAEYALVLRTKGIDEKDFLHCLGAGHGENFWMLTSQPLAFSNDAPGNKLKATFRLTADPAQWTPFGNNPKEQANYDRYQYGPLNDALYRHVGSLPLEGAFGDWRDAPEGSIAFEQVTLKFRDANVLAPAHGAALECYPKGSPCDPRRVVSGIRGQAEENWYFPGVPDKPLVFRWRLPRALKTTRCVIHQDRAMPIKRARVTVFHSDEPPAIDTDIAITDLPACADLLTEDAGIAIPLPGDQSVDTVILEIFEGHSAEGIGIEALEVYASDFIPSPSPDPVVVSADIGGIAPGDTVFYRIACRRGETFLAGEVRSLALPVDATPRLVQADIFRTTPEKTIIAVRGNAMGRETELRWRVDGSDWQGTSMGWEAAGVHRYITLRDLDPDAPHAVTLRLESEAGTSRDLTLRWVTPPRKSGNG
ncbi:MAG: hypothetical protein CMM77_11760 [Rhodospirillaceae bacterium]|nr:hypothetical protein [Magnetovibrio sp.]MAY67793.1 hypothetical protein [Rhodospirillaceae bacterium]